MRLRKPCEHDRYEQHGYKRLINGSLAPQCPGGEFLPEDALVDIAWQLNEAVSLLREVSECVVLPEALGNEIDDGLPAMQAALKTLADQVGEPG